MRLRCASYWMGDTSSSLGLCCALYQKCGFVIVGVVPDANGPGKPDILMAKRVHEGIKD